MAASQSGPKRRWFSRREVEEAFVAPEPIDEVEPATAPEPPVLPEEVTAALGSHVAQLLSRFEEVGEVAKQEASAEATRVVERSEARAAEAEEDVRQLMAKGRDLAASTFAEAERRYAEAVAAKDVAVRRINEAVDQLRSALASLEAIPPFPVLEIPVPKVDASGEPVPFGGPALPAAIPAAAIPAALAPAVPAPMVLDDEDGLDWPSDDLSDLVTPVTPTPVDDLEPADTEPADQNDESMVTAGPASGSTMSAADELQQLLRDLGGNA